MKQDSSFSKFNINKKIKNSITFLIYKTGLKRKYKKNNYHNKIRNPSFEIIRIVSMLSIVINNILVHGRVINKYKYIELSILTIFCVWHVNTFALLSGIVGYKTTKYSNLLYLWLCALFYSVHIYLLFIYFGPNEVKNIDIFYYFFPVVFEKYWYFTSYFGMYLFLPIINNGVSILSSKDLKILVISFLGIFIIWKDFISFRGDPFRMISGYSTLWFLVFYITGAYIGKYKLKEIKNKLYVCITSFIVFIGSTLLCCYLSYYNRINLKIINKLKQLYSFKINSFCMISQSISLTLFFSNLKYNKILSKIINFFGPLTFGVYLIHEHELVRGYIIGNIAAKDSLNLSKSSIILLVFVRTSLIFLICSIIDYLRYLLFSYLKIKKACILIEKKIKQLL